LEVHVLISRDVSLSAMNYHLQFFAKVRDLQQSEAGAVLHRLDEQLAAVYAQVAPPQVSDDFDQAVPVQDGSRLVVSHVSLDGSEDNGLERERSLAASADLDKVEPFRTVVYDALCFVLAKIIVRNVKL
jgi:hypothetical protein